MRFFQIQHDHDKLNKRENSVSKFQIENNVLVKYIGNDEEVIIPEGIISIGDRAFFFNKSIKRVFIKEGVTSIGETSFGFCENLSDILLPKSLKCIIYGVPKGLELMEKWCN